MKRIIIFVAILLLLSLPGCGFVSNFLDWPDKITESWQTITISGVGSFRVPTEWSVEQQDDILYITDKPLRDGGYTIYLVGTMQGAEVAPHEVFEGVEKGSILLSPGFDNGSRLYSVEYLVNGETEELHLITFLNIGYVGNEGNTFELLVWNRDVVDDYLAEQIAKTFKTNRSDFDNPNVGQIILQN